MDPRYAAAATAAASSAPALGGSPNGNSAMVQHLQNLAAINFKSGAAGQATGALGTAAKTKADADEQARQNAVAVSNKQADDEAAYQKQMTDPNNFKRVAAQDGGWDFYDPAGNKINAQQYAQVTGKQITDVLKGSNNVTDQQFTSDYQKLLQYGRALSGSADDAAAFKKSNAAWLAANAKDKSFADVASQFKNYYSGYLGVDTKTLTSSLPTQNKAGQSITGSTLAPGGGNILTQWLNNKQGINYQ